MLNRRVSFSQLLWQRTLPLTELTSAASSPYTFLRCLWISIALEPSAVRNSVTTLCLVRQLLLCWTHVTDSSADDPGTARQYRYPVTKATDTTRCHIKKNRFYFRTDLNNTAQKTCIKTHTHAISHLLLFDGNSRCAGTPHCYVIPTLLRHTYIVTSYLHCLFCRFRHCAAGNS